jgi:hypothetical protein
MVPVLIAVAVLLPLGCARKTATTPAPRAKPAAAAKAMPPLPDWAPKDPSPEFLRAARVIEPDLPEFYRRAQASDDLMERAYWTRLREVLPPAWELFGTLTDAQITRFLAGEELRLPIADLSSRQHALLQRYLQVWRSSMKGVGGKAVGENVADPLVELYRLGAAKDLSNVSLLYMNQASGIVSMKLRVDSRPPSPSAREPWPEVSVRLGLLRSQRGAARD